MFNKALAFATAAHEGQMRKYTFEPYITHPVAVAKLVKEFGGDSEQIVAALLHDTVEDTDATHEQILHHFGKNVAELVFFLTDVSIGIKEKRPIRKAMDRKHLASAPKKAQFVKCADLIHNTSSITEHDKGFAKVYLNEKKALLQAMTKVHGTNIHTYAWKVLEHSWKEVFKEDM